MSDFLGGVKLPAIPQKASDPAVTAIREILNIRFGSSADALDRSPTFRELLDAGAVKYTSIDGTVGIGSGGVRLPSGGIISAPIDRSYAAPPAPTGLAAAGALANITLSWTEPAYSNHAYTEIWRAAVVVTLGVTQPANLGAAVKIGAVPGYSARYVDNVGALGDYWYWIRFVSDVDIVGAFSDVAGVRGTTSQNPAYVLGILSGQISTTELSTSLNSTIGLITAPSTTAGSVAAQVAAEAAARTTAIATEAAARASAVTQEATDRATAITAETNARVAAVTAEVNARAAAITQEVSDRAAAITAEANTRGTAITNEATLRQSNDTALAQSISLLTAGVAGGFDPSVIYYFDANVEGWTSAGATQVWNAGWIDQTSTGTNPQIISPSGLSIAGVSNTVIKARIKRLSGAGWTGRAYFATAGHAFSASFYEAIAVPSPFAIGDTAVIEFDMSVLTVGAADWVNSTITQLRLDLGATAADIISIDWIAVGRNAPGASTAALQTEQLARIAADQAEATARTTLASTVTANAATLATEQTTRANADTALSGSITALTSTVNTNLATLTAEQSTRATADTALSNSITSLTSTVNTNLATLTAEQNTRASADTALTNSITALTSTVNTNAAALTTEQTTRASADTANAASITAVSARLNTGGDIATSLSGNSTAIGGLTTRVTAAEGAITSQSTSITALNSSLANTVANMGVSLLPNWELNVADSVGKPAGIQYVEGAIGDVRTFVSFLDATNQQIAITGASTAAYGFPAIPIDPNLTYTIEVRHKSSAASATGLYLRMNEKNAALTAGKTHVSQIATTNGDARSSLIDFVANGAYPGTAWVTNTYDYKPTAGVKFASFSMYKWAAVDYHVESVKITVKQNDNLIANSNAINTLNTTVTSQGSSITSISGSLTTLTATVASANSAITAEQTARSDGDIALASSISALTTTVNNNTSAITSEATTRASADTTNSSAISTLSSQVNNATTGLPAAHTAIASEASTRATADTANATSISTLSAQVNNATTGLPATYAAVGNEVTARTNADNALASSISSVSTTVAGNTATIATQQTSINGIKAEYTVKLDVNGRMAGFGLSGNGTTGSIFIASVDTFAIESPNTSVPLRVNSTVYAVGAIAKINDTNGKMLVCKTGGTSSATPPAMTEAVGTIITDGTVKWQIASRVSFSVLTTPQTINNVALPAGTYMDGAFIQNATINNAQIGNAAIDSLKIADVVVNTNHIVSGAVSSSSFSVQNIGYSQALISTATSYFYSPVSTTISVGGLTDRVIITGQLYVRHILPSTAATVGDSDMQLIVDGVSVIGTMQMVSPYISAFGSKYCFAVIPFSYMVTNLAAGSRTISINSSGMFENAAGALIAAGASAFVTHIAQLSVIVLKV